MKIKNNKLLFLSILFGLFSAYSFLFFLSPGANLIWILLFIIITVLFYRTLSGGHSIPVIITSAVIGIIYSLMVFFGYELRTSGGIDIYPMVLISFCGLSLFFSIALIRVFSYLLSIPIIPDTQKTIQLKRIIFAAFALLICWLPVFLSCFPGNLTSDSFGEIRQQLGMSPLSNQHTIMHQFLIKICLSVGNLFGGLHAGIIVYTVFQILLAAFTFSFCIEYLRYKGCQRILLIISFLFFAFYPLNGFYSVSMIKDEPFACITILLLIALFEELNKNSFSSNKNLFFRIVIIILLSFLFCTIRNNGFYAFILGFVFILIFNLKDFKRLLLIFCATLILTSGYNYLIFNVLGAEKSESGEMLGIPLQMLARVVNKENPDLKSEDFQILNEVIPDYDVFSENYLPDNSDPIKGHGVFLPDVFDKNPKRYLNSWLKIGLKYPVVYIEAFLFHTQGYWDPGISTCSIPAYVYQPNDFNITQNSHFESMKYAILDAVYRIADYSPASILFSIGFLVMIYLFCFAFLVLQHRLHEASVLFLLAFLWLTAIAAPTCFSQYAYGLTASLPLIMCLTLEHPISNF